MVANDNTAGILPSSNLGHLFPQAPSRHFVHCDNIKYFKISYQAETGEWMSLLASNRMQSKNITGVQFNVRYSVKVIAVNNEDFVSESPVESGLSVTDSMYHLITILTHRFHIDA